MNSAVQTVGVIAGQLGVSVRTLHHWDQLGIVRPSGRTAGGYRTYNDRERARLRRVLVLRELGVPLARIPALLDGDGTARRVELKQRRAELAAKIEQLQRVARDVDNILAADREGVILDDADSADVFGPEWDPTWAQSARERWGDSPQWGEYSERSSSRTPDDWRDVVTALRTAIEDMATAKRDGVVASSSEAGALAERHRLVMSEFFHCTPSMHVLLGRMAMAEPGYRESYDSLEPGLAAWASESIDASARRSGVDPDTARWE